MTPLLWFFQMAAGGSATLLLVAQFTKIGARPVHARCTSGAQQKMGAK